MSQDVALERWLHEKMRRPAWDASDLQYMECIASEAWHAAVKHTLAFVAAEMRMRDRADYAEIIMKLEP